MYEVNQPEYYSVWRKRHHVTQAKIGKYIGCSGAMISYWERGQKELYPAMLDKYNQFIAGFEAKEGKK